MKDEMKAAPRSRQRSLILFSLDLMRAGAFVIIPLICCAQAIAQSGAAAETRLPATSLYQSQVSAIASQAVVPEFARHRERLKGLVMVTIRLDTHGRVKA